MHFGSPAGSGGQAGPPSSSLAWAPERRRREGGRGPHGLRSVGAGRAPGAPEPSDLGIPCLGTVPFDPELARHCDLGIPLDGLRDTPVGPALDEIAQRLLDSLDQVKDLKARLDSLRSSLADAS